MKALRSKILLYFTSFSIIIILLLVLIVKNQITNTNIPLTENLNQQVVTAKAEQIGTWIQQRICELQILTETEHLMAMDMDEIKPFMRRMDVIHKEEFESFAIINLEGQAWVTNDTYIDINHRHYFEKIKSQRLDYVVSDPVISRSNDEPIVVIIHPIKNLAGNVVGYINGAIYLKKLSQIAEEIEMYDGTAWICDSAGNIFTSTEKGIKETINVLQSSEVGYVNFEEVGREMLMGKEGVHRIKTPQNQEKLVLHTPIPNVYGWSLGIAFSEEEMTKDTDKLIFTVLIFGGVLIVVLMIISLLLASSIVKPIVQLQNLMKQGENGNLDIYFDYQGKDEIGQLGLGFNKMILQLKKLISLVEKEQQQKRKAELKVLQAQIQPHFLYNTLDTIRWAAMEDDAQEAVELLEALSTFYRIGISSGKEFISVEEELDHVESYLQLQKARYEDMLDYEIRYDETIIHNEVLKLILQPIIENSILHGFQRQNQVKYIIDLEIQKQDDDLLIEIKDNGKGIPLEKLKKIQKALEVNEEPGENIGFGLYSTNKRIKLTCGNSYGLTINLMDGWTRVSIRYPLIKGGSQHVESCNCR
ncbi:cache domain-containing sensor histidine kinase [Natronincola ferrireducens]|uniref:Two-component system, sensor histidine kinase YesM n=1 Tax=Natronincola ferrireducens TaxID=393762 RepID=A0A1G8Y7K7_9FIRM|nr:sensor histidine kinase [Natronincola ferrireducens]SDJ98768.1 two-component system, sensor histidine kinase YesM [Natronincola ferrireducens]